MEPIRRHDALFRFVFAEPEQMAELLKSRLPRHLAAAIDWRTLTRLEGTFLDPELGERHADLLFVAQLGGKPVLIHVVVEHKSGSYRFTAFQVLRYRVRIWDRWLADHPEATSLPPILPLVIHHGDSPFSAPRTVRELVEVGDVAAETAEFLRSLQPDAPFLLDDLAASTEEDLTARSLSVIADLTLRFLQFLRTRSPGEAAEGIARWQDALRALLGQPRGQDVMAALFSWLLTGVPHDRDAVRIVLARITDSATRQTMKSIADDLIEQGFAKGLEKGLEKGLAMGLENGLEKGRHEGRVTTLLQILRARFGEIPADASQRIAAADEAHIAAWTLRAVTATSVAAVFAHG